MKLITFPALLIGLLALTVMSASHANSMDEAILDLQHQWAAIKYQTPQKKRAEAFAELAKQAQQLSAHYPNKAEPMIWHAIILSTHAGELRGLSKMKALGLAKQARDLLTTAESIDTQTLNGSIHTTLGSLYYQVPGWPLGFGDDKQAQRHLKQALDINPDGLDPNFFYGDYLAEKKQYQQALSVLNKALHAPALDNRPIADRGRRIEIHHKIEEITKRL